MTPGKLVEIVKECIRNTDIHIVESTNSQNKNKISQLVNNADISTNNLICICYEEKWQDLIIFFYSDYMCFYEYASHKIIQVRYEDILFVGSGYIVNKYGIATSYEYYDFSDLSGWGNVAGRIIEKIMGDMHPEYSKSKVEYCENLLKNGCLDKNPEGKIRCWYTLNELNPEICKTEIIVYETNNNIRNYFCDLENKLITSKSVMKKNKRLMIDEIPCIVGPIAIPVLDKNSIPFCIERIMRIDEAFDRAKSCKYITTYIMQCELWIQFLTAIDVISKDKNAMDLIDVDMYFREFTNISKALYDLIIENDYIKNYPERIIDDTLAVNAEKFIDNCIQYDEIDIAIDLGVFYSESKLFRNDFLAAKWLMLINEREERFERHNYGKAAECLSRLLRDGLGGLNEDEDKRTEYLRASASFGNDKAYGELSRRYHDSGEESKARRFGHIHKSMGGKKGDRYTPDWIDDNYEKANKYLDLTERATDQAKDVVETVITAVGEGVGVALSAVNGVYDFKEKKANVEHNINNLNRDNEIQAIRQEQLVAGQKAANERAQKNGYKKKQ